MAGVREYKVQRRDMPLVIGLAVLWFSLQASPYYPLVMSPFFQDADIAAVSLNHTVYAVALTAACVVLMVLLRRAPVRAWLHSSRLPVLCAALGAVASLVMCGAPVAGDTWTFLAPAVPLVTRCASVVVALYVAACCMAFLGRLCARDTRTVVVVLGLSYVLFSIVFLVLTLLDERALSLCLALCPLVALGWLLIGAYGIVVCAGPQLFALDVLYATGVLGVLAEMPLTTPLAAVGAFAIAAAAIVLLVAHSRDNAAQASAQGDTWQTDLCRQATVSYDITPREFDVVVYTYRGYSAKKIAETLLVSESTVKAHLSHCYRKLGIHTKQELIALIDSYRTR